MKQHQNPKNHSVRFSISLLISFAFLLLLNGCVSVQLGGGKSQKANNISFQKPNDNFKSLESENSDHAWQSATTGNTLAYLSECQPAVETSLKTLETESLSALGNPHVLTSESKLYNNRESLFSIADGVVDGVPVTLALLLFQKNGCNFTLTFSGRKAVFQSEYSSFEKFRESFKVP